MPTITTGPLGLHGALAGAAATEKGQQQRDLIAAEELRRQESHRVDIEAAEQKIVEREAEIARNEEFDQAALKIQRAGVRDMWEDNPDPEMRGWLKATQQIAAEIKNPGARAEYIAERREKKTKEVLQGQAQKLKSEIHNRVTDQKYPEDEGIQKRLDEIAGLLEDPNVSADTLREAEAMDKDLRQTIADGQTRQIEFLKDLEKGKVLSNGQEDKFDALYRNDLMTREAYFKAKVGLDDVNQEALQAMASGQGQPGIGADGTPQQVGADLARYEELKSGDRWPSIRKRLDDAYMNDDMAAVSSILLDEDMRDLPLALWTELEKKRKTDRKKSKDAARTSFRKRLPGSPMAVPPMDFK